MQILNNNYRQTTYAHFFQNEGHTNYPVIYIKLKTLIMNNIKIINIILILYVCQNENVKLTPQTFLRKWYFVFYAHFFLNEGHSNYPVLYIKLRTLI